jgi:type VI secretion system protein VasD
MAPCRSHRFTVLATIVVCLALDACAAAPFASMAMDMVGFRKTPELPDAQKPPRNVSIKLHAADNLNADPAGRPLAVIARIYKLRQSASCEQAPYASFLSQQGEKESLGADLLEVKEVILVPGQHYETVEKISKEAYFIGVVALFRAPAEQRWRLAFAAGDAEKSGITVGVQACALSVGAGASGTGAAAAPLAAARCR